MRTTAAAIAALLALSAASSAAQGVLGGGGGGVPGGWSQGDVEKTTETLLKALQGGKKAYAASVGSTRVCYNTVVSVEQQVVSGMNYRFHIDGCAVSKKKHAGACGAHGAASKCEQPVRYVVQVYEQSWTDTLQVTSITKGEAASAPAPAALQAQTLAAESEDDSSSAVMSETEKREVEAWIAANDLNEFGDPKHTMYTGGTPLFDENTGKTIDKYAYIARRHPDRPWRAGPATVRANVLAAAVETSTRGGAALTKQSGEGLAVIIAGVGVLTVLLALVAGVKSKRTRRRFAYDSVANREI